MLSKRAAGISNSSKKPNIFLAAPGFSVSISVVLETIECANTLIISFNSSF